MEYRVRSSVQQFSALLEFMERHGDLARPSPGPQGRLRSDQLWLILAESLNSMGVQKSPDKWKKVWADWKMKTKKKAITIRRHKNSPANSVKNIPILTPFEERLLVLMMGSNDDAKEQVFDTNERLSHSDTPTQNMSYIEIAIDDEFTPHSQSPTQSSNQQTENPLEYTSEQTTNSTLMSPRRLLARARRRQVVSEFLATEQRRLRLEEIREKNESRRIEVEQERNNVLNRFADIAQTLLDNYLNRENRVESVATQ